mmetsp:Transcript_37830/g.100112  ORF Transcript_37830/g.100112 Transcript_37830/m.100112 type:complete len:224 (+) Transcript_37830:1242-1913(+)
MAPMRPAKKISPIYKPPPSFMMSMTSHSPSAFGSVSATKYRMDCTALKDRVRPMTSSSHSSASSSHVSSDSSTSPSISLRRVRTLSVVLWRRNEPSMPAGRMSRVISGVCLKKGNCCSEPQALIEANPVRWANSWAQHFTFSSKLFSFSNSVCAPLSKLPITPQTYARKSCIRTYHVSIWPMLTRHILCSSNSSWLPNSESMSLQVENISTAQKMEIVETMVL